jgi:hypothetical protein
MLDILELEIGRIDRSIISGGEYDIAECNTIVNHSLNGPVFFKSSDPRSQALHTTALLAALVVLEAFPC